MIIVTLKGFDKSYIKLPERIKKAVKERIDLFKYDPFTTILHNHQLKGSLKDYRSINITGDYRLLYEQYDEETVRLIDIGTHSQLFGK